MNKTLVGIGAGIMLLVVVLVLSSPTQPSDTSSSGPNTSSMAPVTASDWSKGNESATAVLVEYGDFQCPACRNWHTYIETLLETQGDNVRFVYRHFPLRNIHPNADNAGRAAEAAGKQGKFWEMYDALYENQTTWASLSNEAAKDAFVAMATELGLNVEQFTTDMNSNETADSVQEDFQNGSAMGINSTPTFILNGEVLKVKSFDEFTARVTAAAGTAQ